MCWVVIVLTVAAVNKFNWNWHYILHTTTNAGESTLACLLTLQNTYVHILLLLAICGQFYYLDNCQYCWGCSPYTMGIRVLNCSPILCFMRVVCISQICDGHETAKFIAVNLCEEFLASFVYIKCISWAKSDNRKFAWLQM